MAFGATGPAPAVMAFLRSRFDGAIAIVYQHLATRAFLVGVKPTIADISLSGYVFYPVEESGIDIAANYPHLGAWIGRLRQLKGWGDPYEVMPGERSAPRW
jgi:glutathione S-transferase